MKTARLRYSETVSLIRRELRLVFSTRPKTAMSPTPKTSALVDDSVLNDWFNEGGQ